MDSQDDLLFKIADTLAEAFLKSIKADRNGEPVIEKFPDIQPEDYQRLTADKMVFKDPTSLSYSVWLPQTMKECLGDSFPYQDGFYQARGICLVKQGLCVQGIERFFDVKPPPFLLSKPVFYPERLSIRRRGIF